MPARSACTSEAIKLNSFPSKPLYELYEYIESCLLLTENLIINRDLKSYYHRPMYIKHYTSSVQGKVKLSYHNGKA